MRTPYNYQAFLEYVGLAQPRQEKLFFSDIKEGDTLYEIIEKTEDFLIVEREVKWVKHIGKKTHFALVPMEGLKDCDYCPYSNKSYTMSKQFNPIFVRRDGIPSFLQDKFDKDRNYLMQRLASLSRKKTYLRFYAEGGRVVTTSTRRARRPVVIPAIAPFE